MQEILDVAIIGAGVSGVYCGWRLLDTGTRQSVTVFEASDRVGGRLLSVEPPGMPDTRAELGGMRILPATQPRVAWVVEHFDIATYPFPVDDATNIAYLRDVHLRLRDFADPAQVPYSLNYLERGQSPGNLVINAIEQIVPGITQMSEDRRREVVRTARFQGRPLYKQGFWQVLYQVMSPEAYALAVAGGGYMSTLNSWNAADAIPWFLSDFGVDAKYYGFTNGFQEVPLRLAQAFTDKGGQIIHHATLQRFDYDEERGVNVLVFADGSEVLARTLILAMPRRSLELIEPSGTVLGDPVVRSLLASVTPQPLFKLFCAYRYPWWLAAGVDKGRTVTDLPIRQTYYWPTPDGGVQSGGRSLLMASYDDGFNIDFWSGYRPKRRQAAMPEAVAASFEPLAEFVNEERGSDEWERHHAPLAMVEEVQRQIAQVHDLEYVPKPYAAAFMDWGDDPWGGGWNSWNIGVRSWEVEKAMIQPVAGVPAYVCGEAYSSAQGWVEGALDTADQLLARAFGLTPPTAKASTEVAS